MSAPAQTNANNRTSEAVFPGNLSETEQCKAIAALVRRFGASIMPYEFRRSKDRKGVWVCLDVESGSSLTFSIGANRLHIIAECDGAAS